MKHGHTKNGKTSPEYSSWHSMISRCKNPNCQNFKYYGGRGIQVCKRWHKFCNFLKDMGPRPKNKFLDRWPNNNGDYEPENCRWATKKEQANNRRQMSPMSFGKANQFFFYGHGPNGEMIIWNNQHDIAKQFGLDPSKISKCLCGKRNHHKGWSFQRI